MFRAGLLSAAAIFAASPAWAQLVDPTAFHVTDSKATNSDPVLLNEDTTFDVNANDLAGTDAISSPMFFYLIEPLTAAPPKVDSALYEADPASADTFSLGPAVVWNTATVGTSFYKDFLSCGGGCDGSVNLANINAAELTVGIPNATEFDVYKLTVNVNDGKGFTAKSEFEDVNGLFGLGTVVAPYGTGGNKVFDTSWTNAGFVNTRSISTPEASTWVMMVLGFGLIGGTAWRRSERRLRLTS